VSLLDHTHTGGISRGVYSATARLSEHLWRERQDVLSPHLRYRAVQMGQPGYIRDTLDRRRYWLPRSIREILYGGAICVSSMRPALSLTYAPNELMRLCFVRWQSERRSPAFGPC